MKSRVVVVHSDSGGFIRKKAPDGVTLIFIDSSKPTRITPNTPTVTVEKKAEGAKGGFYSKRELVSG